MAKYIQNFVETIKINPQRLPKTVKILQNLFENLSLCKNAKLFIASNVALQLSKIVHK